MTNKVVFPLPNYKSINGKIAVDTVYLARSGTDCYVKDTRMGIHTGWDLNGPAGKGPDGDLGDSIESVADGIVEFATKNAGFPPSWGRLIVIRHPQLGVWTRYAHMSSVLVKAGDEVKAGQKIGEVGKGWAEKWPAHLHFDVIKRQLPTSTYWNGIGGEKGVTAYFMNPLDFFVQHGWARESFTSVNGACKL